MNKETGIIDDSWIISQRGKKNKIDPRIPYGFLVEKERTISGTIEDTGIIFLTNRECPFHCLMCDLWKNTTDKSVPSGAIPDQIRWGLQKMPGIKHLKLYNSGSFFDTRAIPAEDLCEIAELLSDLETVIVECHPRFISEKCLEFKDLLKPELHIAMGLETVHQESIQILNKKMTPDDFRRSAEFLVQNSIEVRSFILLRLPYQTESEGIYWAEKSIDFAFNCGVECCIVIPVRAGNGVMDHLMQKGVFSMPEIKSLETVLEYGLSLKRGRVFADVWDLQLFPGCDECKDDRIKHISEMNLSQVTGLPVNCSTCQ